MSDQPNRKMDELLKSYANKRHAEAGDPQMHPATRKMLQSEVQRTFGKSSVTASEGHGWSSLWPRIAIIGAACAVIIAGFIATNKKENGKFDVATAQRQPESAEEKNSPGSPISMAEMDAVAPSESARREVATDDQSAPAAAVAVEQSRAAKDLETGKSPPSAPAALAKREISTKESARKAVGAATVVSQSAAAPVPATDASAWQFTRVDQPSPGGTTSVQPRPLSEFELQPEGDRIRILDSDGSVYLGKLTDTTPAQLADRSRTLAAESETAARAAAKQTAPDLVQFAFEVSGTNVTLNRPIRFQGVLRTTAAKSTATAQEKLGVAKQQDRFRVEPGQQVEGKLFIDEQKPIEVDAVRTQ